VQAPLFSSLIVQATVLAVARQPRVKSAPMFRGSTSVISDSMHVLGDFIPSAGAFLEGTRSGRLSRLRVFERIPRLR
jgi:hypothetical protein